MQALQEENLDFVINPERNYWFVRTNSGKFYEEFVKEGYVAVGHNQINLPVLEIANKDAVNGLKDLTTKISETEEENGRPTATAKMLLKFAFALKAGDIVLIPSAGSWYISMGIIINSEIYENTQLELSPEKPCTFYKRKKVKWLKNFSRPRLDKNLLSLIYTHLALSNANGYSHYIDRSLHSFFAKEGSSHLIFHVQKKDDVKARTLIFALNELLSITDELAYRLGWTEANKEEVDIKLNIESPGFIELFEGNGKEKALVAKEKVADAAKSVKSFSTKIFMTALISHFIVGGEIHLKMGENQQIDLSHAGFVVTVMNAYKLNKDLEERGKLLAPLFEELKLKTPEEIKVIMETLDLSKGDDSQPQK